MLQIEGEALTTSRSRGRERAAASGGLLFLTLLIASWVIAIGIVWAAWRLLPL